MKPAAVAGFSAGPDLAGSLCLRPGGSLPTISSTRREWAPTLARGRPAEALPALLGAVFTLCGGAHRVAAGHAVAAARGQAPAVSPAQRRLLQVDTLREHLRRLWLDAPRLLPDVAPGPDPAQLAACPVMAAGATGGAGTTGVVTAAVDLNATRDWVAQHVLGQPVADWLAAWQADPAGFSRHWAGRANVWPARWLAAAAQRGLGLRQRPVPLQPHASALELRRLAGQLQHEQGFALAPTWRGHTAETGCWTRLADPLAAAAASPYTDIVLRLAARVADVARLVADGGERWLHQGALELGPGEGLGWCEMARGLLLHRVRLDEHGHVADCRLVAPTEWNFHPFGTAARALALLPPQAHENRVRLLAAAYDPCVAVQVVRVADEVETPHA